MNLYSLFSLHNDIFDDIKLPESVDKTTCINTILDENGIFPFRNHEYPFCKKQIESFFNRWFEQFDRIAKANDLEYDLIQNYDRNQEYTRTVSRSGNNSENTNGTDTTKVSAYNETAYQPDSETSSNGSTNGSHSEDETETIRNREYGDIGVDTTAQKIKAEIEMRKNENNNIYYIISNHFFSEFMLRCI